MNPLPARHNPFRSKQIEALAYRFDDTTWNDLLGRFEALGRRAALVGPKGSGKTTLLEEIEKHFEAEGWDLFRVRLRPERRSLPRGERARLRAVAGPKILVSVDGAEQLGILEWHLLRLAARRAGGLLITTHSPAKLPTLHEHTTNPDLLHALVAELTAASGNPPPPEVIADLYQRHRGNLRECFRDLYLSAGRTSGKGISPSKRTLAGTTST